MSDIIIRSDNELKQGSDVWKEHRRKGIGSSDIATVMGLNPYSDIESLWLEKTGKITPPDISNNYFVKRGTALEPIARDLFNHKMAMRFETATFESREHSFMRYSSDGYDRDAKEIIEIKCMGAKNHNKLVNAKEVPGYYYPQCQWGMMISESFACSFIGYNPEFEDNMIVVDVWPDEDYFKLMTAHALRFWHCVQNDINPLNFEESYLEFL